jgi:cytochrome c
MRKRRAVWAAAVALAVAGTAAVAQQAQTGYGGPYNYGTPATQAEIAAWDIDAMPDGRGLPAGSGTYAKGADLYAGQCAACHGPKLEGVNNAALPRGGGDRLVGGRGTLNTPRFVMTVESYWPYATTLFDYIRRAMPYNAPGSLKNDEIYSLVAYILGEGNVIDKNLVMDAQSLPKVQMPNRDGFYLDDRPEPVQYD